MTYIANDVLLTRMTQKEKYLSVVFDALEAKCSYLLAFIAVLAGLPAVIADKIPLYWGKWTPIGSIMLVIAILFAALAAAAILWVLSSETYHVEDTEGLISWRDAYVASLGDSNGGYTEAQITGAIQSSLIQATATRIGYNQKLAAEKLWRIKTAYYATTLSAAANLILLIPIATHQL